MSDYKTCPLNYATMPPVLQFDGQPDMEKLSKDWTEARCIMVDRSKETTIAIMNGCDKSACAWWDELKQCCAVLTIARAAR